MISLLNFTTSPFTVIFLPLSVSFFAKTSSFTFILHLAAGDPYLFLPIETYLLIPASQDGLFHNKEAIKCNFDLVSLLNFRVVLQHREFDLLVK
jgi:hypothetical protein